jgi:DNA invertase Pin-like site-specific DNA recombinase
MIKENVIYIRQSEQGEKGESLEFQEKDCRKRAEQDDAEIHRVLKDPGFSGVIRERPAFQELLELAQQGKIGRIYIWKYDRFSRNAKDRLIIMDELRDLGCEIISATQSYDLETPDGELMGVVDAGISQYELRLIRQRIMRGKKAKLEKGKIPSGSPPFGYLNVTEARSKNPESPYYGWEPKVYEHPEKANKLREVFRLYSTGKYTQQEVSQMTRVPQDLISTALRRKCYYTGIYIQKLDGIEYPIKVPPLIDRRLFDKAEEVLETCKHYGKPAKNLLLEHKMMCGVCNQNLTLNNMPKGYSYYRHICKHGKVLNIPAEKLDNMVWDSTVALFANIKEVKRVLRAFADQENHDYEGQIRRLKEENERLESNRQKAKSRIREALDKDDWAVIKTYEEEIRFYGNKMDENDRLIEKIYEDWRKSQEIAENIGGLVKEIDKNGEHLRIKHDLNEEEKRAKINQLYPDRCILFWPKWWLEEKDYKPTIALVSTVHTKQGIFLLNGYIQVAFSMEGKFILGKVEFTKNG